MKKLTPYLVCALCLADILWIMHLNSLFYLPSGNDPLHWLAWAKALLGGVRYPLWSEGLMQYPPVPLVLHGLFARIFGDILGTQLFGAVVFGVLPLSTFLFVNRMFGHRVGLAASLLVAATPALYEMWGYGMYPNLFGFSVLFVALFAMMRLVERKNKTWAIIAGWTIVLVMFSHPLTSIVFVSTLAGWTALSFVTRRGGKELLATSLFAIVTFAGYHLIVPPQYVLSNHAAAFTLAMDYSKFVWVFKSIPLFVISASCTGLSLYLIYRRKPAYSLLLVSFIVSSFILTYGLPVIGINLDPPRFLIFSLFGLAIGVAYLANEVAFRVRVKSLALLARIDFVPLASLTLVAVIVSLNWYIGIGTSWNTNLFNHTTNGIAVPRGDAPAAGLVSWIKNNTGEKDVFVADTYLSNIIMGLGERRVLESGDLAFLFIQGESERAVAADSLLHSNQDVHNASARIRDQYPVQNQNPIVSLWANGNYNDIVYFADGFWEVTMGDGGNAHVTSPWKVKTSSSTGPFSVTFTTPEVVFKRDAKIEDGGIRLNFSAEPVSQNVTLSNMKIYGWRPWNNNNLEDIRFDNSVLTLVDGKVNARVMVKNYQIVDYYLADPVYKQAGFCATFSPQGGHLTAEFFIPFPSAPKGEEEMLSAPQTIGKYDISYFAVRSNAIDEILFLEANGYKKAYGNPLVSVYRAN